MLWKSNSLLSISIKKNSFSSFQKPSYDICVIHIKLDKKSDVVQVKVTNMSCHIKNKNNHKNEQPHNKESQQ